MDGYAHQDIPFEMLVEDLQPQRDLSHSPLFQVVFVMQNAPMSGLDLPELTMEPVEGENKTAKFDLSLQAAEGDGGIFLEFEYNSDIFAVETIENIDQPIIFASDADAGLCKALARSLASANLANAVSLQCRDFFTIQPKVEIGDTGLVVLNPPYGRRLGTDQQGEQRMRAIAEKLLSEFHGWRLALIVPHKRWLKYLPATFKTHPLHHGGLRLYLAVGKLPNS